MSLVRALIFADHVAQNNELESRYNKDKSKKANALAIAMVVYSLKVTVLLFSQKFNDIRCNDNQTKYNRL